MTRVLPLVGALLQAAILVTIAEAARRRDVAAAMNAVAALLVALSPTTLALLARIDVVPELTVWLGVAGFLHALGMLGLYETTWWWDHLTHAVSAALLAALVYAATVVARTGFGVLGAEGVTLGIALVAGLSWELLELVAREVGDRLDVDPVLVYYGRWDTALDLVFDLIGTLLVLALDLRVFVPVARQAPGLARTAILGGGLVLLAGSLAMALFLGRVHGRLPP